MTTMMAMTRMTAIAIIHRRISRVFDSSKSRRLLYKRFIIIREVPVVERFSNCALRQICQQSTKETVNAIDSEVFSGEKNQSSIQNAVARKQIARTHFCERMQIQIC